MMNSGQSDSVVLDTGPLIAIGWLDMFAVLHSLYPKPLIPNAVFVESQAGGGQAGSTAIATAVEQQLLYVAPDPDRLPENVTLGQGELACIALAQAQNLRVVLDDKKARYFAKSLQLPVLGTAGLLIHAKQKGLIPMVTPLLHQLQDNGYYFSSTLLAKIKTATNE